MDISTLEGKSLQFRSPAYMNNRAFDIVVVIADNDVGFSATLATDKGDNFVCYHGPASADKEAFFGNKEWEKAKEYLQIALEKGTWDARESEEYIHGRLPGNGSMTECAFS